MGIVSAELLPICKYKSTHKLPFDSFIFVYAYRSVRAIVSARVEDDDTARLSGRDLTNCTPRSWALASDDCAAVASCPRATCPHPSACTLVELGAVRPCGSEQAGSRALVRAWTEESQRPSAQEGLHAWLPRTPASSKLQKKLDEGDQGDTSFL